MWQVVCLKKLKISPTCIRSGPKNMLERGEGLADWTRRLVHEIQGIRPHVSDIPSNQSTQLGHLSHLESHYHSRSKKKRNYISVQCRLSGKIMFFVGTIQRIYLSSGDICCDNTLVLGLIRVEFFNVFNVCLNSRRWFVLCLVYIFVLV
jgi:hypothetical protein